MPSEIVRRHATTEGSPALPKSIQKAYPLGLHRTPSVVSISPLSLSQNSNDSSLSGTISTWERKISLSFHGLFGSLGRRGGLVDRLGKGADGKREFGYRHDYVDVDDCDDEEDVEMETDEDGNLKRCCWITKSSEENYVKFHDEFWGVPVYDDNKLFELLSLSGMLIDHNWSNIMKKREQYREIFGDFDPNFVAKMEEKDIVEIGSKKELMLAESRVRSIVENARCILEVVKEFGSFSGYIWSHVNDRPTINRYKHPKSVPFKTPKSEFISKELLRRGFRLVGPVIVYSFMQAAGMVIDHLVSCFRYKECVKIAERSWGMTSLGM